MEESEGKYWIAELSNKMQQGFQILNERYAMYYRESFLPQLKSRM